MFLGTNNMLALAAKFNQLGNDVRSCITLINETYNKLPEAIYEATMADSNNLKIFIKGLTQLEKANGVKISNPSLNKTVVRAAPKPAIQVSLDTCLFDISTLEESEKMAILGYEPTNDSSNSEPPDEYKIKQLNLANCCSFPILSPRLVESLGQRHEHALWRSKNLGVIAPLSAETLIKLAGITAEEIKQADYDADNLIRKVDRMDVDLPVGIAFFGKDCAKGDGFIMGQKDHMAKPEEKRNDFYIKKIWRTYCPYIKCNCQKYTRCKSDCMDGGIKWFDHAIWYMLNHLDKIWPTHSAALRFALFSSMIKTPTIRTAVVAYIGFLRVRSILINMTRRYAEDQTANLNLEFGNTKLTDVLEKTVRPIKFLIGKTPSLDSAPDGSNYKRKEPAEDDESDVILPPSVFKRPAMASGSAGSNYIDISSEQTTPDTGAAANSVNKIYRGGSSRVEGLQGNIISY